MRAGVAAVALLASALVFAVVRAAPDPWVGAPPAPQQTAADEAARAAKTIGPDTADNNCATCHAQEVEAWQNTSHYTDFTDRHRSPRALAILKAMGQRTMKREPTCRQCHYTSVTKDGAVSPQWGVSCESCHGPGADWAGLHNRVRGDANANVLPMGTGKDEAPAARQARLGAAAARGMIHSQMIYEIAVNCFSCHIVSNEELVNKGGHKTGSDFDLVAWSQGAVRHNYVSSPGAPSAPTNRAATAKELRRLYVTGAMVDYEFSLRNLAAATVQDGPFYQGMVDRTITARKKVNAMLAAVKIPELASAVAALPLETKDAPSALRAADCLRDAICLYLAKHDGSDLAALDPLIPTSYKGRASR
jgi:hypothetical protein